MLKFKATSSRVDNGRQAVSFFHDKQKALDWARIEFNKGYDADVVEVLETPILELRQPKPEPASKSATCPRGHEMKGHNMCPVCGERP